MYAHERKALVAFLAFNEVYAQCVTFVLEQLAGGSSAHSHLCQTPGTPKCSAIEPSLHYLYTSL
jgi:hypothetical protein